MGEAPGAEYRPAAVARAQKLPGTDTMRKCTFLCKRGRDIEVKMRKFVTALLMQPPVFGFSF
jgi:hypothetical protein